MSFSRKNVFFKINITWWISPKLLHQNRSYRWITTNIVCETNCKITLRWWSRKFRPSTVMDSTRIVLWNLLNQVISLASAVFSVPIWIVSNNIVLCPFCRHTRSFYRCRQTSSKRFCDKSIYWLQTRMRLAQCWCFAVHFAQALAIEKFQQLLFGLVLIQKSLFSSFCELTSHSALLCVRSRLTEYTKVCSDQGHTSASQSPLSAIFHFEFRKTHTRPAELSWCAQSSVEIHHPNIGGSSNCTVNVILVRCPSDSIQHSSIFRRAIEIQSTQTNSYSFLTIDALTQCILHSQRPSFVSTSSLFNLFSNLSFVQNPKSSFKMMNNRTRVSIDPEKHAYFLCFHVKTATCINGLIYLVGFHLFFE